MYLSRLLLNPRSRQVQRETANPYQRHRTIMSAFPASLPEGERVLHRLDVHQQTGVMTLLVQSQTQPDWQGFHERDYLLPADAFSGLENPAVKPFTPALSAGQTLRFRLRANPTVKKKREGKKNSNRVPLVREERQLDWLRGKGAQHGFDVLFATAGAAEEHRIRQKQDAPPLTVYTVQFQGRLRVTDAKALQEAVRAGIGPAKAFGCGLLSLAPG